MPLYRLETRETTGRAEVRQIAAETAEAAVRLVRAQGEFVITVERVRVRRDRTPLSPIRDALFPVSPRALSIFFLHLGELVSAGHSVGHALSLMSRRVTEPRLARFCEDVANEVRSGTPLSEVMALYPGAFPSWVAAFVAAAEQAGALDTMLPLLEEEFRSETQFRRRFTVASIYTKAILVFSLIAATSPSAISLGVGGWLMNLVLLLAFCSAGLYVLRFLGRVPIVRRALSALGLHVPIFGGLQRSRVAYRVSRAIRELIHAGVSPEAAFETAAPVSGYGRFSRGAHLGADALRGGTGLGRAFAISGIFGRRTSGLMMTAEETGELDSMMDECVQSHRRGVGRDALRMTYTGWGCLILIGALLTILAFYLGASGYVNELLSQFDRMMEEI